MVNVASRCGLTEVNYPQLAALEVKYKAHGLRVLGFPSNQFADQEPGTYQEIKAAATSFGVSFPLFAKADVAGPSAQPIFDFLEAPKWNFTKYLIGRDLHPFQSYGPRTPPLEWNQTSYRC
ncbi:hypothetical protein DYB28_014383 [Aphanomyces astaci]|uniref:Glutathione peroxidase n=1 Tax=Aphanomyces astaci TaxID=112090 RepID=A0A9X8H595_APHAT|nr:hypothetical protein DYB28_014383 [Aphanomyces astaci]